jgi:hypothetical protein
VCRAGSILDVCLYGVWRVSGRVLTWGWVLLLQRLSFIFLPAKQAAAETGASTFRVAREKGHLQSGLHVNRPSWSILVVSRPVCSWFECKNRRLGGKWSAKGSRPIFWQAERLDLCQEYETSRGHISMRGTLAPLQQKMIACTIRASPLGEMLKALWYWSGRK